MIRFECLGERQRAREGQRAREREKEREGLAFSKFSGL